MRLKTKPTTTTEIGIDDLADLPRWVAWRVEEREGKDGSPYKTKIPHDPNRQGLARIPTHPSTWGTRAKAEACWQRLQRETPDALGGVGIVLGTLDDGDMLMGIDLDSCVEDRAVTEWADEVIERFGSYTEVSPSGKGVKLFFLIANEDVQAVKDLLEGKTRRAFVAGEHREIALDWGRFYAVTGDILDRVPATLATVQVDEVRWLLHEAGPRFQDRHREHTRAGEQKHGRDDSGSGHGYRFMAERKKAGDDYEAARAAILADNGEAGEWARRVDERQLQRAWDAASAKVSIHSWEEPDLSILDDRRGELPPFPLDVLPDKLRDLVERATHGAGCSLDHVAMPLLGVASALVGNGRRVRASRSFSTALTEWVAIVGFSGSAKSPGMAVTKNALDRVEEHFQEHVDTLRREHEERADKAEAAHEAWKSELKKAAKDHREAPARPQAAEKLGKFIEPRLVVVDVTIEKLCELLVARPKGMLLLIDELAGLLLNMQRYSGGMDNQFWLMAWDGKSYSCERKSGPSIKVPYLLVGVVGGIQPDRLSECFKTNDGMHARFIWTWPAKAPYRPLSDDIEECDQTLVGILDNLSLLGEDQQKSISLSEPARAVFEQLRLQVHEQGEAFSDREREWWHKIPLHVLRLAGTLCYMEWASTTPVWKEPNNLHSKYIKAASRLTMDYLWPHARACLRQIGLNQSHADARRVLRWITASRVDEVGREDIRRKALSKSRNADETQAILEGLTRAGWLCKIESPTKGRPSVRWKVNPRLFDTVPE
jgi:hypothetical protein